MNDHGPTDSESGIINDDFVWAIVGLSPDLAKAILTGIEQVAHRLGCGYRREHGTTCVVLRHGVLLVEVFLHDTGIYHRVVPELPVMHDLLIDSGHIARQRKLKAIWTVDEDVEQFKLSQAMIRYADPELFSKLEQELRRIITNSNTTGSEQE